MLKSREPNNTHHPTLDIMNLILITTHEKTYSSKEGEVMRAAFAMKVSGLKYIWLAVLSFFL
jgi:hypothetical protein